MIARRLGDACRRRGTASIALSGGSTAPALIEALVDRPLPWESITAWQVDERVAPDGTPTATPVSWRACRARCG